MIKEQRRRIKENNIGGTKMYRKEKLEAEIKFRDFGCKTITTR